MEVLFSLIFGGLVSIIKVIFLFLKNNFSQKKIFFHSEVDFLST